MPILPWDWRGNDVMEVPYCGSLLSTHQHTSCRGYLRITKSGFGAGYIAGAGDFEDPSLLKVSPVALNPLILGLNYG